MTIAKAAKGHRGKIMHQSRSIKMSFFFYQNKFPYLEFPPHLGRSK